MNGARRARTSPRACADVRRPPGPRFHRLRVRRRPRAQPYAEDAAAAPRTAYGRTKLAGERGRAPELPGEPATCVRTAWLYGAHGPNFVRTMIRLRAGAARRRRR